MDDTEASTRLLDAAEKLFYERGIQAVGMDDLRTAAGISLKRLYQCFPSKQQVIEAYLTRRDERWRADLADYVAQHAVAPEDRVLAVFDWLQLWFSQPNFRGCAFVNSAGELGARGDVAAIVRYHKETLLRYLTGLTSGLSVHEPAVLAKRLLLLVDGATTTAAIMRDPGAANEARDAARILIAEASR